MPELYTPEWEKEEFNRLAPELEERIKKQYAGRGAFFGGQNKRIGQALAKLAQEISGQSASARYQRMREQEAHDRNVAEQRRREGVIVSERMRQEGQDYADKAREESLKQLENVGKRKREFDLKRYEYEGRIPDEFAGLYPDEEKKKKRGFGKYADGGMAGVENQFGVTPISATGAGYGQTKYSYPEQSRSFGTTPAFATAKNTGKPNYRYEVYTRNNLGNGDASQYGGDPESAIYVYDWDTEKKMSYDDYRRQNPVTPGRADRTDINQGWQNKPQSLGDDNRNWLQKTGDSITEGWRNFTDTFGDWFSPQQKTPQAGTESSPAPVQYQSPLDFGNPESQDEAVAAPMKKMGAFARRNPYRYGSVA